MLQRWFNKIISFYLYMHIFTRYLLLIGLMALLLIQGCKNKKEELDPVLKLEQLTILGPASAGMRAMIVHPGTLPVREYGFVYATSQMPTQTHGTRIPLGTELPSGIFTHTEANLQGVSYHSTQGATLYVRAYLRNDKGIYLSAAHQATLPVPGVSGIQPAQGKAGDQVTISGNFIHTDAYPTEVTFNGVKASITESTSTRIVAVVPDDVVSKSIAFNWADIKLHMAGRSYTVYEQFKVHTTFLDFSPKSGPIGSTVNVEALNLDGNSVVHTYNVLVDGIRADISNHNGTGLTITIPNGSAKEELSIAIEHNGITTRLAGTFKVTPPTVSGISPVLLYKGRTHVDNNSFTLKGSDLPRVKSYTPNTIFVGDVMVTELNGTTSEIQVWLPPALAPGIYPVTLQAGPYRITAPQALHVKAPFANSINPMQGAMGGEIDLLGGFRPETWYELYFNDKWTQGYSATGTSLRVKVPMGLPEGPVSITLLYLGGRSEVPERFTVVKPSFSGFSPASGARGTVVTLHGKGFSLASTVAFGNVNARILSISDTEIRVTVPDQLPPAYFNITVTSGGFTFVSTENFQVLP